jgi:hypothetical protein
MTEAFCFVRPNVRVIVKLATLQKTAALSLLGVVLAWAAWAISTGRAHWAWLGPAVVALGYAGVLAVEFWLLRGSYSKSDPLRPNTAQLLTCWARECAVAPRVFLWQQPFRSMAVSDALVSNDRRGVLLVHGFVCNRGLWNPWLRELRAGGIPFAAVNLEPVFGSIDGYADTIDGAVRSLTEATGSAPVIVAHSMGGLAVRAWITRGHGDRFHRLVTIATPHRGTRIARHAFSSNTREMQVGSAWLESLSGREPAALYARFTCFWGHCDNIVFPTGNATLPGADNRHLPATPHVQMAYHPAVLEEVRRLLAEPSAVSRSGSEAPRSAPGATPPPLRG